MKTIITRNHGFEDKLNYVKKNRKTYDVFHEKSTRPLRVKKTEEVDQAFEKEDWGFFEDLEAAWYPGCGWAFVPRS